PPASPPPSRPHTPPPPLVGVHCLKNGQAADPNSFPRESRAMVLSDRTIRRLLDEGRIAIDPFDETLLQPSSVDVRVDRYFRVFRNSRYPYINVKEEQEDLTELVQVDGEPFIL